MMQMAAEVRSHVEKRCLTCCTPSARHESLRGKINVMISLAPWSADYTPAQEVLNTLSGDRFNMQTKNTLAQPKYPKHDTNRKYSRRKKVGAAMKTADIIRTWGSNIKRTCACLCALNEWHQKHTKQRVSKVWAGEKELELRGYV